ncbi:MAG TPA: shikimate kinase [Blastocatellia bacterium]|jgi:shikimate kinase
MRIFLVGFMGAGKTTVGRVLAEKLSCRFIDLDELIEARSGMPVRAIFKELGEREFRRLESAAIESLSRTERAVIALGGGAFASDANRRAVGELGISVWLDCALEVCLARMSGDGERPLLGAPEKMAVLLESRRGAYQQSDCRVDAGRKSPGEIADEIIRLLDSPGLATRLHQY